MTAKMKRRAFITLLGGAAAWQLAARAQQAMPVIGFLSAASASTVGISVANFQKGLSETGYFEGRNVAVVYRWAEGRYDRLPALASELVAHNVNVIIAGGGTVAAQAAKAASSTIPIVFMGGGDPIEDGLIKSLNHPGGNVTGVNQFASVLIAKRLELLREMVPKIAAIGVLTNSTNPNSKPELKDLQVAATALGCAVHVASATTEREIEPALEQVIAHGAGALVIGTDALFVSRRVQGRFAGCAARASGFLHNKGVYRSWRPDELRSQPRRFVAPSGCLRWAYSQRGERSQFACATADQIRACHQPQDRQGARP